MKFNSSFLLSIAAIFAFKFDAISSHNYETSNEIIAETESSYNGIPIKKWRKELKEQYGRSLRNIDKLDFDSDRGDLQVLRDYYQNGRNSKKKQRTIFNSESTSKNGIFDVIIIGAGWAGISAAMTLESKGITNYQILEARDYIGGRSRTITETFNGEEIPIDVGSMWIHGGVDNPLYDIVTTVGGVPTIESDFTELLYKASNDGPFTDQQYSNYYRNLYQNGFMDYQAGRQESTNRDEALQVSANMYTSALSSNLQKNVLRRIMTNSIELEYSAPMDEMSLWWWDMDGVVGSSKDLFLPEGYSPLIEAYAAPVTDRVSTGCVVSKINYRKNIVKVTYTKSGSQTIVRAKKVIVTVPLGVLKANTINFVPKLPATRRRSIQKLGMGRMNKIFMFWNPNDIFWPSNVEMFSDIVQSNNDFQFFNAGVYNGGKPMLFAFFAGSELEAMENQQNFEDKVTALAMVTLRNMFGNDIKDPEKIVVTKWNQDQFSYGTYSFNKLGAGRNFRKTLAKPIRRRRVFISGEATHFSYFQTTHGAYLSGITAANKAAQGL